MKWPVTKSPDDMVTLAVHQVNLANPDESVTSLAIVQTNRKYLMAKNLQHPESYRLLRGKKKQLLKLIFTRK